MNAPAAPVVSRLTQLLPGAAGDRFVPVYDAATKRYVQRRLVPGDFASDAVFPPAQLGTGGRDGTKFLGDDGVWRNVPVPAAPDLTNYARKDQANTFAAAQTFGADLLLSGDRSVRNPATTSRANFGMLAASSVAGGYFTVFGNQYATVSQRGGAEFVFDSRNGGTGGFGVFAHDGSTWTRKLHVWADGVEATVPLLGTQATFNSAEGIRLSAASYSQVVADGSLFLKAGAGKSIYPYAGTVNPMVISESGVAFGTNSRFDADGNLRVQSGQSFSIDDRLRLPSYGGVEVYGQLAAVGSSKLLSDGGFANYTPQATKVYNTNSLPVLLGSETLPAGVSGDVVAVAKALIAAAGLTVSTGQLRLVNALNFLEGDGTNIVVKSGGVIRLIGDQGTRIENGPLVVNTAAEFNTETTFRGGTAYTDPDVGTARDAKFGGHGIAASSGKFSGPLVATAGVRVNNPASTAFALNVGGTDSLYVQGGAFFGGAASLAAGATVSGGPLVATAGADLRNTDGLSVFTITNGAPTAPYDLNVGNNVHAGGYTGANGGPALLNSGATVTGNSNIVGDLGVTGQIGVIGLLTAYGGATVTGGKLGLVPVSYDGETLLDLNASGGPGQYGFGISPNTVEYRTSQKHRWWYGPNGSQSEGMSLDNGNLALHNGGISLPANQAIGGGGSVIFPDYNGDMYLTAGNGGIVFRGASNAERARFTAAGQLLVAAPGSPLPTPDGTSALQVGGDARVTGEVRAIGSGAAVGIGSQDGAGRFAWFANDPLRLSLYSSALGNSAFSISSTGIVSATGATLSGNATAGPAKIGDAGHGANYAAFGHSSKFDTESYALLHDNGGSTYLNAAAGQIHYFRKGNATEVGRITSDGQWILGGTLTYNLATSAPTLQIGQTQMWRDESINAIKIDWVESDGTLRRKTLVHD